jgi:hypothetical protein
LALRRCWCTLAAIWTGLHKVERFKSNWRRSSCGIQITQSKSKD